MKAQTLKETYEELKELTGSAKNEGLIDLFAELEEVMTPPVLPSNSADYKKGFEDSYLVVKKIVKKHIASYRPEPTICRED